MISLTQIIHLIKFDKQIAIIATIDLILQCGSTLILAFLF